MSIDVIDTIHTISDKENKSIGSIVVFGTGFDPTVGGGVVLVGTGVGMSVVGIDVLVGAPVIGIDVLVGATVGTGVGASVTGIDVLFYLFFLVNQTLLSHCE